MVGDSSDTRLKLRSPIFHLCCVMTLMTYRSDWLGTFHTVKHLTHSYVLTRLKTTAYVFFLPSKRN